jgi:hypothetical protein
MTKLKDDNKTGLSTEEVLVRVLVALVARESDGRAVISEAAFDASSGKRLRMHLRDGEWTLEVFEDGTGND